MRIVGLYLSIVLFVIYVGVAVVVSVLAIANYQWPRIDFISVGSLLFFLAMCVFGILNERTFLGGLVFVMVAFPTAVNNFIPGIYLGNPTELGASIFPALTHIDIYLIVGIARFAGRMDASYVSIAPVVLLVTALMWLSLVINTFDSSTLLEAQLLVCGSFQFRYFVLIYLILLLLKEKSLRAIAVGLSASVLFLLVESLVFTSVSGSEQLSSGSLATNTFGNIVAQVSVFLLLYSSTVRRQSVIRLQLVGAGIVGLAVALLTQTRMSLFSALASFSVMWLNRRVTVTHVVRVSFVLVAFVLVVGLTDMASRIPKKFRIWEIASFEMVHTIMREEVATKTVIEYTPETSSIITRIQLFRTSLRMISDDPVWGIGPGRWDYFKEAYGFDLHVLIDSHNGYLALLSQYGLIAGFVLIVVLFVLPIRILLRSSKITRNPGSADLWQLGVITLGMSIAELSNAGVSKPQVFALLVMIAMILLAENKKASDASRT